jgi:hypothetical protein
MTAMAEVEGGEHVYRCGAAARWLPRALAGAVLAAGLLVAFALDPDATVRLVQPFKRGLVLVSALVALWLVRKGGEVRVRIGAGPEGLVFLAGRRRLDLPYRDIAALRYEPPFGVSRWAWIPALALIDRQGRSWRIPALIERGERLVAALLDFSGRADLASWADALDLERRMSSSGTRVAAGYGASALIVVAAVVLRFR